MQTLKIKSEFGEKKVGLNFLTLKSELRIKFSHMECTKLWTYFFFFLNSKTMFLMTYGSTTGGSSQGLIRCIEEQLVFVDSTLKLWAERIYHILIKNAEVDSQYCYIEPFIK